MQDMRISQSDREFFVRLLAEYGLTRGGVKSAVGDFLVEKEWKDTRAVRVKLLSRMRVCNPNYDKCKPQWREYYESERARLKSETADRHLTRALARDRHLTAVMAGLVDQIVNGKGKEKTDAVRAFSELVKAEVEVEKHERGSSGSSIGGSDTGASRQVEPAGSGSMVRELIAELQSLNETEGDV